jgi:alkylation response protein AidB-like acyl-CoA dehydrogenase
MAPEVFEALSQAGFFALWKPRAVGGYETDAVTALKIFEALSKIDASVGWAVANQDGLDTMVGAVLGPDGAIEILADPLLPISGGAAPPGKALRVDGGYVINGRWPFSSTCHYAQSYIGLALLHDDNGLVTGADGQPTGLLVFSQSPEVQIIDTWRTLGMRGSGSHDIAMTDLFIPERHAGVMRRTGVATEGPFSGPLYAMTPYLSIATSGPVGLGIAEAAIELFADLATKKTPNYLTHRLDTRQNTQSTMGRCRAIVNSARAYLHQSVEAVYAARQSGVKPTMEQGVDVQLSTCAALEAGARVTELIHDVIGSSGFQEAQPFEQLMRDSDTISQNAYASTARYEACGQTLLGQQPGWAILAWAFAR